MGSLLRPFVSRPPSPSLSLFTQLRTRKYLPFVTQSKKSKTKGKTATGTVAASVSATRVETGGDGQEASDLSLKSSPFQGVRLVKAFDLEPSGSKVPITFSMKLNIDMTREAVRGVCSLPVGLGRQTTLLAFCPDEMAQEMLEAGADFAGLDTLIPRIADGWVGFDRCIASIEVMPRIVKLAKILGPRRLMPNQKSGTVVTNLREAVRAAKSGSQIEYRAVGDGVVKVQIADSDFSVPQILENVKFFVREVLKQRPRTSSVSQFQSGVKPFSWPPPRYVRLKEMFESDLMIKSGQLARRAPIAMPKVTLPKDLEGQAESEGVEEAFILDGSFRQDGGPKVRLLGDSLMPNSSGYFR